MLYIIIVLQIVTIGFLYLHVYYLVRKKQSDFESTLEFPKKSYSVVLPVSNEENHIKDTLELILVQKNIEIDEIIVVINNSSDRTMQIVKKIEKSNPKIHCIVIDDFIGKSTALINGIRYTKNDEIFLLDADIKLKPNAFELLASQKEKNNSTFIIGIIQYKRKSNWESKIIEFERYFINSFLQRVRGRLGVATIHGSFTLVTKSVYLKYQKDLVLQEDLFVTYKSIANGYSVKVVECLVADEEDRDHIVYFVLQRIRWLIGNINLIPTYIQSLRKTPTLRNKLIVASYPFLWYIIYYVISFGYLVSLINNVALIPTLILHGSYLAIVIASSLEVVNNIRESILWGILHALIFPHLITITLILTLLAQATQINKFSKIFFTRGHL